MKHVDFFASFFLQGLFVLVTFFSSAITYAVDLNSIQPKLPVQNIQNSTSASIPVAPKENRYRLIGVIANSKDFQNSIAVLRDRIAARSLTVKVGQIVPGSPNLVLDRVEKNVVVLKGNRETIEVRATGDGDIAATSKPSKDVPVTSNQESIRFDTFANEVSDRKPEPGLLERWVLDKGRGVVLTPSHEAVSARRRQVDESSYADSNVSETQEFFTTESDEETLFPLLSDAGELEDQGNDEGSGAARKSQMIQIAPSRRYEEPELQGMIDDILIRQRRHPSPLILDKRDAE